MHVVHGFSKLLQLVGRTQRLQSDVGQFSLLNPELRAQLRHRRHLIVSLLCAFDDTARQTQSAQVKPQWAGSDTPSSEVGAVLVHSH